MASSTEYVEFIYEQLKDIGEISYKKMFGEYVFYYGRKVFGGVYDDRFLVKITNAGMALLPNCEKEPPYTNAKPMFLVDEIEDKVFLKELVLKTCEELQEVKIKKARNNQLRSKR
ncbi:MAG: TfoX/Sxy family protein [Christensenellaceae bacterium]